VACRASRVSLPAMPERPLRARGLRVRASCACARIMHHALGALGM